MAIKVTGSAKLYYNNILLEEEPRMQSHTYKIVALLSQIGNQNDTIQTLKDLDTVAKSVQYVRKTVLNRKYTPRVKVKDLKPKGPKPTLAPVKFE